LLASLAIKGGEVVHFSGFARKMNHILPLLRAKRAIVFFIRKPYKINPITIAKTTDYSEASLKLAKIDNKHLLKIFFKYYLIGRVFEKTGNMIGYISDNPTFTITKGKKDKKYDLYGFIKVLVSGRLTDLDGTFTLNE
jgi:hypothetical protein